MDVSRQPEKKLFWVQYDLSEESNFTSAQQTPRAINSGLASSKQGLTEHNAIISTQSFSESHSREVDERQKAIYEVKKLADELHGQGKLNEAFVLFVELMIEIKALVEEAIGGEISENEDMVVNLPFTSNLMVSFDHIKLKASDLRRKLKDSDIVKNPMCIILENVMSMGLNGAEEERFQNWSAAADTYYHAMSCLNFLERYLRSHGTSVDQGYVFKYIDQFKYRRSFAINKMRQ